MRVDQWPPSLPDPDATLGTINTLVLLASVLPNQLARTAAEKMDLRRVRILLPVCVAFGVAFVVIRAFEFASLNTSWNSNAYGSIVWVIMGLTRRTW